MRLPSIVLLVLLGLLMGSRGAKAAESYDSCTGYITSVPATIHTSGTWCLKQDVSTAITSGVAIEVAADNVTIDCNGFRLDGLAAGTASRALGIHEINHYVLTVRHCTIRGFYRGILSEGGGGTDVIEDNHVDGSLLVGIEEDTTGSTVRHNLVTNTGGTTATASPYTAYGIYQHGNTEVLDNDVSGLSVAKNSNASVVGIMADDNGGGSIDGNTVRGMVPDGTGSVGGILVQLPWQLAVRKNEVHGGGFSGNGIACSGSGSSFPAVRVYGNVISGFASAAIAGCGVGAGNDTSP